MVEVINYNSFFYHPNGQFKGLEKLVLLPGGETRPSGIPVGSVWQFDSQNHEYDQRILGNDVGCGMTAFFMIPPVDLKVAADKIASHLAGAKILGSGNHFIDLCGNFETEDQQYPLHNMMIIHTDGKSKDNSVPKNIESAQAKVVAASEFRKNLGNSLANVIGVKKIELFGDWPHNTVEYENGKYVYRKGTIKVFPEKVHILPSHLHSSILFYTVAANDMPIMSSMPHATGRKGPTSELKVSEEKAREMRKLVYIPERIKDSSLRSEHPDCFNSLDSILDVFGEQIVPIGDTYIKSYVGKV